MYCSFYLILVPINCSHSLLPLCKGEENQYFKQDMLKGENFLEVLVGRTKRRDSMFCDSSVRGWGGGGGLVEAGQFFLNELEIQPFHSFWSHIQNNCSVMIDHCVIHIFYIFLLPLDLASLVFYPIFIIERMQKCEHKLKGKKFPVWSKESLLFFS